MPRSVSNSIFVAGASGMVGSAITRALRRRGHTSLLTPTHKDLDLTRQEAVERFFRAHVIDTVIVAAAKVGGIEANRTAQADFLYENLAIATNVICAAAQNGVAKLVFLGSACIYPKVTPQPIREEYLLTAPLEPTNEGYAIAKIAGLKLCEMYRRQFQKNFFSLMPTNLYGPGDNFDLVTSHVIPALLRKFHQAKQAGDDSVTVWGTGRPTRDFLHVDDLAEAVCVAWEKNRNADWLNVGSGQETSMLELAEMVKEVVGFSGAIHFDTTRPDGTPRRVLDSSRLHALGWKPATRLREGLESTYRWMLDHGQETA